MRKKIRRSSKGLQKSLLAHYCCSYVGTGCKGGVEGEILFFLSRSMLCSGFLHNHVMAQRMKVPWQASDYSFLSDFIIGLSGSQAYGVSIERRRKKAIGNIALLLLELFL